jgi:hypothetical protein
MTPQEEAAQIFASVVCDLAEPAPDIKRALRHCLHACQILGWSESAKWFEQELGGYFPESEIPPYRRVTARLIWQSVDVPSLSSDSPRLGSRRIREIEQLPVATAEEKLRPGIDWLLEAAEVGFKVKTGETTRLPLIPARTTHLLTSPASRSDLMMERVQVIDAATCQVTINTIEHFTFEFASKHYAQLAYGEALADIWQGYRRVVDEVIAKLDFGDHLSAIQSGIQSTNPQDHRNAVFGCRNLLEDFAEYLWRDPRETYTPLKGEGEGGKLKVTRDRSANRLSAYLHQKGIAGKQGKYHRDEFDRLAVSLRSLIGVQSQAYADISLQDAQSIAIATYIAIGTVANLTDLEPIEQY